MNRLAISINSILSDWNPIGVDEGISKTEYLSYVPQILESLKGERAVMQCLKSMLQKMGIDYDLNNKQLVEDLNSICKELLSLKG